MVTIGIAGGSCSGKTNNGAAALGKSTDIVCTYVNNKIDA